MSGVLVTSKFISLNKINVKGGMITPRHRSDALCRSRRMLREFISDVQQQLNYFTMQDHAQPPLRDEIVEGDLSKTLTRMPGFKLATCATSQPTTATVGIEVGGLALLVKLVDGICRIETNLGHFELEGTDYRCNTAKPSGMLAWALSLNV